ncbi:MAG: recombinase family protein [Oscillospiraceae bacterium]|nr:recombinase family protein [Oscillospiraceae bacterium]
MPDFQSAANAPRLVVQGAAAGKEAEMNNQMITLLYARLSKDDGEDGVSNSINNQLNMLRDYAERNGFTPYIAVQDDGYSGTNFQRPGWQELVSRVESGEVSTIICKDSSRMARNYLQAGLYRQMFQEKGVRLICVNDGIDTFANDDDFTPFREILAEWYARDCSRKVRSVLQAKGRGGKPLSANPPYGFIKDPDDKNRWLIDPESAVVVKRIFNMTVDGKGPFEIARTLAAEKVERPSYYMGSRGYGNHQSSYNEELPYAWNSTTVATILTKPEYCGHTVNFKTRRENFKSKKTTQNPAEEWLIFENTHEPIVSQGTWDTVQKLRGTPRRIDHLGEANPLTGKLFCADCGAKMYNHRRAAPTVHKKNGKTYTENNPQDVYQCSTHKLTKYKSGEACSLHHILTSSVREIILDVLQKTGGYVREHEDKFVELVRAESAIRQGETAKTYHKQIAKNERRITELEKIFRSLYEDKALDRIDEERFAEMSAGYEREKADLKSQTAALQSELDAYNADSIRADKFIELVRKYTRFEVLTSAMINELVDKVIIHEGKWTEGINPATGRGKGTRHQKVEVFLKYVGVFDVPEVRTPEEIEAERAAAEKSELKRTRNRERRRQYVAAKQTEKQPDAVPASPKPAA